MHHFPFGSPLRTVEQHPVKDAKIFVLGVYASAVHARWLNPDGTTRVRALAVASEPNIFWDGTGETDLIKSISLPREAGSLVVPGSGLNGPSGRSLDAHYLKPLGCTRSTAWLCDLLPQTRLNSSQVKAIREQYDPLVRDLGLPDVTIPRVPKRYASRERAEAIVEEFLRSRADTLVTLGDVPLAEFVGALRLLNRPQIAKFGTHPARYGRAHEFSLAGQRFELVPLVHPRHAARLGLHAPALAHAHDVWRKAKMVQSP